MTRSSRQKKMQRGLLAARARKAVIKECKKGREKMGEVVRGTEEQTINCPVSCIRLDPQGRTGVVLNPRLLARKGVLHFFDAIQ